MVAKLGNEPAPKSEETSEETSAKTAVTANKAATKFEEVLRNIKVKQIQNGHFGKKEKGA